MRIALLSNIFQEETENKEVNEDLMHVAKSVKSSLENKGHEVIFFDVNEQTFEKLRIANVDIAFNVCERFNGVSLYEPHIASMLELLNIPYTGSGPLTLATCINKIRVKEILSYHGIPTPSYQVFYSKYKKLDPTLRFPLIVKPSCMDNSIGITNDSVVFTEEQMRSKVGFLLKTYNQPVLVEEFIDGRELTVGIIGNTRPIVLPVTEQSFCDVPEGMQKILGYESKWYEDNPLSKDDSIICPAPIPKYLEAKIKKVALDVYEILGVRDYGRVDIRLSKDNVPYVLEMNPNPGISAHCYIPTAARSIGITYEEMINRIFTHALERYNMTKLLNSEKEEIIIQKPESPMNDIIPNY